MTPLNAVFALAATLTNTAEKRLSSSSPREQHPHGRGMYGWMYGSFASARRGPVCLTCLVLRGKQGLRLGIPVLGLV